MDDGTPRAPAPVSLAALRLTAALDGRTRQGQAAADTAVTPGDQLAAALGTLRSLTALAARFDQPAADKITGELAQAARDAASTITGLIRDRIHELSAGKANAA